MRSSKFLNDIRSVGQSRQVQKLATRGERVLGSLFPSRGTGWPGGWSQDRLEQVLHLKNWVFVAVDLIASKIASLTPNIAYVVDKPTQKTTKVCERGLQHNFGGSSSISEGPHSWLTMGAYRSKALSVVKPHEELEPVESDHILRRLFENPNPVDTQFDLTYELQMFEELTGVSYEWLTPSDYYGMPCERWCIPSHWVWPRTGGGRYVAPDHPHADELIQYYEIRPWGGMGSAGMLKFPPNEVIMHRWKSPINKIDGYSKLAAISQWIDEEESISRSRWSQAQNIARPEFWVELGAGYEDPTDDRIARIEAKFAQKLQGEYNYGKPVITPPGAKITPLSFSPAEMAYFESEEQIRDMILSTWRIPPAAVGIVKEMTYGSILATLAALCTYCLNPRLVMRGQTWTKHLASRWNTPGYNVRIWYDDCVPADPDQINKDIDTDSKVYAISPNEVRTLRGRKPWRNGGKDPMAQGPGGVMPLPLETGESLEGFAELIKPMEEAEGLATGREGAEAGQIGEDIAGKNPQDPNQGQGEEQTPQPESAKPETVNNPPEVGASGVSDIHKGHSPERTALRLADFVELPQEVEGTNCGNCEYNDDGECQYHDEVDLRGLSVDSGHCCAFWDSPGTMREWQNKGIHYWTHPKNSRFETALIHAIENVLEEVESGPDYQNLFFHPDTKDVWWETADGDDGDAIDAIVSALEAVPGVGKVQAEAEASPPRNEGWQQIYPRKREWKSLAPPWYVSKDAGPHSYSCVMLEVGDADIVALKELQKFISSIDEEDLAEDGREMQSHITVKYGLHTDDAEEVRSLVEDFGPVIVTLGKLSLFTTEETGEDYEVLKMDVAGEDLERLNDLLASNLDNTDKHPEYNPHLTLAYLKPGTGEKYLSWDKLEGTELVFNSVDFSEPAGSRETVSLGEQGESGGVVATETVAPAVSASSAPASLPDKLLDVGKDKQGVGIRQPDHYSCGAAVAMAVGHFFKVGPDTLEEWKEALGTTEKESTSPLTIAQYLSSLGLNASMRYHLTLNDLQTAWSEGSPVICPIQEYGVPDKKASFEYGHYVTVKGVAFERVIVYDPSIDNVLGIPDDEPLAPDGTVGDEPNPDVLQTFGESTIPVTLWEKVWHDEDAEGNTYDHFGIVVEGPTSLDNGLFDGEIQKGVIFDSVQSAGRWLAGKWQALEGRYGRKPALAMALAMVATSPLPGNIAAIIGAAEAIRGVHAYFNSTDSAQIQPSQPEDTPQPETTSPDEAGSGGDNYFANCDRDDSGRCKDGMDQSPSIPNRLPAIPKRLKPLVSTLPTLSSTFSQKRVIRVEERTLPTQPEETLTEVLLEIAKSFGLSPEEQQRIAEEYTNALRSS